MVGGVDDGRGELLRFGQSKRRPGGMYGHAYGGQGIGLCAELDRQEEEDDTTGIHLDTRFRGTCSRDLEDGLSGEDGPASPNPYNLQNVCRGRPSSWRARFLAGSIL